ncbi:MAG: MaoC/PaaZ C-terminal domain-containing protein [Woeseia sp.]
MALDYDKLMGTRAAARPSAYDDRDTMLYALSVGFGGDPMDESELPYVYEGRSLKTVPAMASTLTPGDMLVDCGWDYSRVVFAEQRIELYRPLPAAGRLLTDSRVVSAFDRGPELGALVTVESDVRLAKDDTALFTSNSTVIARGDGGFGGPAGKGLAPHKLPARDPDLTCEVRTRPDQALLYRLCRDRNPLHADPVMARQAGFARPILHGLCTYGIACRAILKTICNYDYTLICGLDARFTAPVIPGDSITTEMWQDRNILSFRCIAKARGAIVINNGKCTLAT